MDIHSVLLGLVVLSYTAFCLAEQTSLDKRDGDANVGVDGPDDDLDKHVFRYGRSSVFRYGKRAPSVFRYGKRGPSVFRYGKREGDETMKRLFRWGKRSDDVIDDDTAKRIFRWGKRSDEIVDDDDDDFVKRMVFRYGKRGDDEDDQKRRIFNFGKRELINTHNMDIRGESPHVPFRFGEDE